MYQLSTLLLYTVTTLIETKRICCALLVRRAFAAVSGLWAEKPDCIQTLRGL